MVNRGIVEYVGGYLLRREGVPTVAGAVVHVEVVKWRENEVGGERLVSDDLTPTPNSR